MAEVTITEEPITTQEEPVTMQEEPVTISEEPVTIPQEPITMQPESVTIPEEAVANPQEPPEPKRKPGRPTGSKNREPGKPRKPRAKKVEIQEAFVENRPPEPLDELPRAIAGSMPIPEEAYDLRTAKMLRLLQMQSDHRKSMKRNMYSSWFR